MKFSTVREDIHTRYPRLTELVDEQFPEDKRGVKAFKYAFELWLRALPNLHVAVDGWTHLNVVEELPNELRAVGIMWILPSSKLPIDVKLRFDNGKIEYRILVGSDDERWAGLTESKRWKAVYLYATEGTEPLWNWDGPVQGSLDA
jgi:hypothetical protein